MITATFTPVEGGTEVAMHWGPASAEGAVRDLLVRMIAKMAEGEFKRRNVASLQRVGELAKSLAEGRPEADARPSAEDIEQTARSLAHAHGGAEHHHQHEH